MSIEADHNIEATAYPYAPIEDNQLRLMYLWPGSLIDELRCDLRAVDADKAERYEALSYRWGSAQEVKLFCDGHYLLISEELAEALRRFRLVSAIRVLWVDQICINQKSISEQSAQVRRMGATYSNASEVLVWLGEEDAETAKTYKLITDVCWQISEHLRQPETMRKYTEKQIDHLYLNLTSAESDEWVAFRNLNMRPWFTRTWTFQELVLSRQASITCGSHSISWTHFLMMCQMVSAYDNANLAGHESHLKGTYDFIQYLSSVQLHLSSIRSQRQRIAEMDSAIDLLNLVMALRRNKTSRPRDKIFGLWGCAGDVKEDPIISRFVDYSQPWELTYAAFTKWFIMRYQDLSVFRLINVTGDPPKLPSWTPDFSRHDEWNSLRNDLSAKVLLHGQNRIFNATGSTVASSSPDYDKRLLLHGLCVGTIVILTEPAGNLSGDVGIGQRVHTHGEWHKLVSKEAATNGIYLPTGEHIDRAYHRLRIGDQLWGENAAEDRRRRLNTNFTLPEPQSVSYSDALRMVISPRKDISTLILKWTTRQRLYITDTGYMGLCHRSCKLGDQAYLLMGGEMPFVLRKKDSGEFLYKGETYIHGLMDGEYLIQHFKSRTGIKSTLSDESWLASLNKKPLPFETQPVMLV
jgi:hypothetical protein